MKPNYPYNYSEFINVETSEVLVRIDMSVSVTEAFKRIDELPKDIEITSKIIRGNVKMNEIHYIAK